MKVRQRGQETVKVCFVSSWFPSRMNPHSAPFIPAFVKRFKKAGLKVSVITTRNNEEPFFDPNSRICGSIPVYRINRHFAFFQIFKLVAHLRPDIIHVHAPNFFSSFAVIVGKILRTPVVTTIHRVEVSPTKNPLVHFERRIALNLFDRIVVVSGAVKYMTEKCGVRSSRISAIWNSADEGNFKPRSKENARKLLHLPLEKRVIIFVGRLVPIKGIHFLVRALPSILREWEAILVIVGEGSERSNLKHLVDMLNLEPYVLFIGNIPAERLALYYNAADVFALPSLIEGHSVVLLEAMASGLPVVATDVGGNSESIINEVNGFLVCSKDYHALAQAISAILNNEGLRQRFSAKSLELYRKNFSERTQVVKYFSVYDELLKKEKRPLQQIFSIKQQNSSPQVI